MDLARPTFRGHFNLEVPASGSGFLDIPNSGIQVPEVGTFLALMTLTYASFDPADPATDHAQGRQLAHSIITDGAVTAADTAVYGVTAGVAACIAFWSPNPPFNPPTSWDAGTQAIGIQNSKAVIQKICIDWSITICNAADATTPINLIAGG